MKMVAHQTIGVNLPSSLAAGLAERGQKALAILVVSEDVPPLISAIDHMINRSGVFNS
jgi:hypothetical protein